MAENFDLFVRRVLHDVRNILQQMTVGVNKIKLNDHKKEHAKSIELIQGAVVNVDILLSRFHDLVRIRSYESHPSNVQLVELMLNCLSKRPVKFIYEGNMRDKTIRSDEALLKKFFNYILALISDMATLKIETIKSGFAVIVINDRNEFFENILNYYANEDKILSNDNISVINLLAYLNTSLIIKKEGWKVSKNGSTLIFEIGADLNENESG